MDQLSGIPGYPGDYAEPRFAYRENLAAPLHKRSLRREGAEAPYKAVILTSDWQVIAPGLEGDQLDTAVADFQGFMEYGMETTMTGSSAPPVIQLTLAPDDFPVPESYAIEADPDGITIRAGDVSGLQYALYELEDLMTDAGGPWFAPFEAKREPFLETRILRSFYSPYYANELLDDTDYYPDEYLNRLAHHRLNGIWIHAILRDLVPSEIFPEFGQESGPSLVALKELAARAARYGIRIFLYLLEPRSLPLDDPFWAAHLDVQGTRRPPIGGGEWPATASMCISDPRVREWLTESCRWLYTQVPELAGAFCITASEAQTNCYSHYPTRQDVEEHYRNLTELCPRCGERSPEAVVTEVMDCIAKGIHAANPKAKVIAWNWSWEMLWGPETNDRIVELLPEEAILMCDFERGEWKTLLDRKFFVDEYSLSIIGPSERMRRAMETTRRRGLPIYAKLQFCCTHELATVPYMPLPGPVFDKFDHMRQEGVSGMLGCWIFGNHPGLITDLAGGCYFGGTEAGQEQALTKLARRYFGAAAVPEMLAAWAEFAEAWTCYPFYIPLIYDGPMNAGPAFPLFVEPLHKRFPPSWLPGKEPGDNMLQEIEDGEVLWFDRCLAALLEHWREGLLHFEAAFKQIAAPTIAQLQEYGIARAAYHQMTTLRNVSRFYVEREFLLRSESAEKRRAILLRLQSYLRAEVENSEACLPYAKADNRLGWHSEANIYLHTPELIREKIEDARQQSEVLIPAWLADNSGLIPPAPYDEPLANEYFAVIKSKLPDVDLIKGIYPEG